MLSNLGKALRNTFAGVVWRFAVFALAVAGFSGLMGLRQWHTHYAPSEVWAQEAAGKGLDWSPVVGAAATKMLPDGKAYDDKASFQRALLKEIRNPEVPLDLDAPEDRERLDGYREALARKKAILKEFHREIDPRDSVFARKTEMLSVVNAQIAEISAQLEQLRNDDGAKPQEIKGQEKRLKDLLERRADLRMDIKEQSLERGTVETGPARSVLGALSKVEGKKMRVWKLRRSLRTYSRADANPAVHDLLQKLMPLILKTSRMG